MTTAHARPAPRTPSPTSPPPSVGRNSSGTITIHDCVVAKIAARAAWEVPDVGAAAPRLIGKPMTAAHLLGARSTTLRELPKASARVDGDVVIVELSLSVRWPTSIPAVTRAVRQRVRDRVTELTGLRVAEVTIEVSDLVTDAAGPPRVH